MHPKRLRGWAFCGLVLAGLAVAGAPATAQPPAKTAAVDKSGAVIVPLNGSVRVGMKSGKLIRSVFNSVETVVNVLPDASDPRFVILFGRGVGVSRVELTDVDGGKEVYEVVVQPDVELLRNLIRRAVPTATVDVLPGIGGTLILSGNVARLDDVDTILRIANSVSANVINAMQVGGVHQVQLDVVVARVDRTKLRQRGFNFGVSGTTFTFASILGGLAALPATQSVGAGATTTTLGGIQAAVPPANIVFGIIPANFLGVLQALKSENVAKLLAEPKLVTQSGRPARFLAGGRQATLGPSSGINGPGVVYEDIGTELEFLPVVYGNGKIYLEVAPRVRGVNQGLGITTSFGTVPGFDEQSVRTSIVLEPGQTFAIGGLIQANTQGSSVKWPLIGELPFVGPFFSVNAVTDQESELVILVTPHLVDGMDCNQVPAHVPGRETRTPDDFEFYLESMLEQPRGPRNVFAGRHFQAGWHGDPTAAEFPCYGGGFGGGCATGGCASGNCAPGNGATATVPQALPAAVNGPADAPGAEAVQVLPVTPGRRPAPR
jgi:pilus assembly protein CpaC